MKKIQNIVLSVSVIGLLTACGSTTNERALSGAGIGAGIGAVGGAIAGANPIAGAVVGGAVGAAVGVVVDKSKVDLGKPAWK